MVEEVLDLYVNLTLIQGRLLSVLEENLRDAEERVVTQGLVQRRWDGFTGSFEESVQDIRRNLTGLVGDLMSGLLYLQRFMKDSTKIVLDELDLVREGVGSVRGQVETFRGDISDLVVAEANEIRRLGEIGEGEVSAVVRRLENFIPIVDHLSFVHSKMVGL
jgi:hypothetical protein